MGEPHAGGAAAMVISCHNCAQRLRIADPDRKHQCPLCGAHVVSAADRLTIEQHRRTARRAIGCGAIGILPWTWPAGLYLLAFAVATYVLSRVAATRIAGLAGATLLRRQLAGNVVVGLRDAAFNVAAGCAAVALVQLVLHVAGASIAPDDVKAWEIALWKVSAVGKKVFDIRWHLGAVALLLFVASVWPPRDGLKDYKTVRKLATRSLTAVTVASCFTFLTVDAIITQEREWIARRRNQLREAATAVQNTGRDPATNEYLRARVEGLARQAPAAERLRESIGNASTYPSDTQSEVIERLAARMARDVPRGERPPVPAAAPERPVSDVERARNAAVERVLAWAAADSGKAAPEPEAPTPIEAARVFDAARESSRLVSEAQSALEDTVKHLLGTLIPTSVDPLLKPFVKALSGGAVNTFLPGVVPKAIGTVEQARRWVGSMLNDDPTLAQTMWSFEPITPYTRPPEPPPRVESGGALPLPWLNPLKIPRTGRGGQDRSQYGCCERCTTVNGAITSCVYIGCGPQCIGARPR